MASFSHILACAFLSFSLDAIHQQNAQFQSKQSFRTNSCHIEKPHTLRLLLFNKHSLQQKIHQASFAQVIEHMKQIVQLSYSLVEHIKFDDPEPACEFFGPNIVEQDKRIYQLLIDNSATEKHPLLGRPISAKERLSWPKIQWLYCLQCTYTELCKLQKLPNQQQAIIKCMLSLRFVGYLFHDLLGYHPCDLSKLSYITEFESQARQQLHDYVDCLEQLLSLHLFDYHRNKKTREIMDELHMHFAHDLFSINSLNPIKRYDHVFLAKTIHATIEIPVFAHEKNKTLWFLKLFKKRIPQDILTMPDIRWLFI